MDVLLLSPSYIKPTRRCKPINSLVSYQQAMGPCVGPRVGIARCGANSNQHVRSNRRVGRKTNTLTSVRCVGLAANAPVVMDALALCWSSHWIYNLVASGTALLHHVV